jgi:hypothetical protein
MASTFSAMRLSTRDSVHLIDTKRLSAFEAPRK